MLNKNYYAIISNLFKKIFSFLSNILYTIILTPYFIKFIFINKKRKIEIIKIRSAVFGHFFIEPLIFLLLRKKKNNLFFYTENIITNYFFYSFLKKKIKIDNKLKYFINISKFLKLKSFKFYDLGSYLEEKYSINLNNCYQKLFFKQSKIKIKFNFNEKKIIKNFLKINKINIKKNKFVVIASRDNNYKQKLFNSKYFEQNYRNFKFHNLKKLIFDLNQKGIKVIRIAQLSKPIKYIKHKNFIDLNSINKNEDVLYFWLIKN